MKPEPPYGSYNQPADAIFRLLPNGSPDESFGTNGVTYNSSFSSPIKSPTQSDGSILLIDSGGIARYTPDGILDPTFGTDGSVSAGIADGYPTPNGELVTVNGVTGIAEYLLS